MKIDENRKSAILNSLLKPKAVRAKDSTGTDDFILRSEETIDKLELSTQKSTIDRPQEKTGIPPVLLKELKGYNFIDKVELSTRKKSNIPVKEKVKYASTIVSQDRINALLEALQSETYNARVEISAKNSMKSQLLDIVI
ncbi:MAG: hypothetical protein NT178_03770 [Proteobacteria bacterium]|nr:hypothetical protein [Pseudomonadota bacterium]